MSRGFVLGLTNETLTFLAVRAALTALDVTESWRMVTMPDLSLPLSRTSHPGIAPIRDRRYSALRRMAADIGTMPISSAYRAAAMSPKLFANERSYVSYLRAVSATV